MVDDCIFCKIARKEIAACEVIRTERAVVIHDLAPQAPTHLLVIPVRHAADLGAFAREAEAWELGELFTLASTAGGEATSDGAYRLVVNQGAQAGQTVFHLHLHVLAGRAMAWPPG